MHTARGDARARAAAGGVIMTGTRLGLLSAILVLTAQVALAGQPERKDLQVANDIVTSVNRYAFFTIFDDIRANVADGVVTLAGKVTMPYKSSDLERQIARIDGVSRVINRIEVLGIR